MIESIKDFVFENKGKTILLVVILFFAGMYAKDTLFNKEPVIDPDAELSEAEKIADRCGITVPEGMIVTSSCVVLPAGDPTMRPEDVGFTYLRALSNLDLETAARYSYETSVLKQYDRFYELDNEFGYDQAFTQDIYKEVLLSLAVNSVADIVNFPDGRMVITYNIDVLDLTDKDFWQDDRDELFDNLEKYRRTESDITKSKEYLYRYVRDYYRSPDAKKRQERISITIDKVVGFDHWVVAEDSALDAIAKYLDGELVVTHIMMEYDIERN